MKWRILLQIPCYPGTTQIKIIVACMALHNFVRLSGINDVDFGLVDQHVSYVPSTMLTLRIVIISIFQDL
jgi:hypothetical protein